MRGGGCKQQATYPRNSRLYVYERFKSPLHTLSFQTYCTVRLLFPLRPHLSLTLNRASLHRILKALNNGLLHVLDTRMMLSLLHVPCSRDFASM